MEGQEPQVEGTALSVLFLASGFLVSCLVSCLLFLVSCFLSLVFFYLLLCLLGVGSSLQRFVFCLS